jgi:hypothetical protein
MTEESHPEPPDNTSTPPVKRGSRRQTILIVVLLLMGGGLTYDRKVARPGSQQGYDTALELVNKNVETSADSEPVTNEAVHTALGKQPSKLVEEEDYTIETFSWRRGLLVLSYDVHIVYAPDDNGRLIIDSAHLNKLPEASQLPGYEFPPVVPPPGQGA